MISKDGTEPPKTGTGLPPELYEDRALIVMALRLEGYTYKEICQKTGLEEGEIRYACFKARSAGKLRDVIDLVTNEAVPQAVDNLVTALRDPKSEYWWRATEKTLEGRGVFQRFGNTKNAAPPGSQLPALQINFLSATGGDLPTVVVNSDRGAIVGVAREEPAVRVDVEDVDAR